MREQLSDGYMYPYTQNARKRGPCREYLRDASKMPCLMKLQTQGLITDESERPIASLELRLITTVEDDIVIGCN